MAEAVEASKALARRPLVLQIITGLPVGGAQAVLEALARRSDALGVRMVILSLADRGSVGERLVAAGITVDALSLNARSPDPRALQRIARRIRQWSPDIVHTWLYHADLLGGLAARMARAPTVLWNLRATALDAASAKWTTALTIRLSALLSRRLPDRIVACSEATRADHVRMGYDAGRMIVIDNGVDLTRFAPDAAQGQAIRRRLGIPDGAVVIGLIARYHAMKNHEGFLRAAGRAFQHEPHVHLLLCGQDVNAANPALAEAWRVSGLGDRVHLLDERGDVPALLTALDIHVSASRSGEGFSNAVLEAMAAGVPCVVTDVGDSARIVGDTGWIVPPARDDALTAALSGAAAAGAAQRQLRAAAARRRAEHHYSLDRMVAAYRDLYRDAAAYLHV